jgi:protease-4
MNRLLPCALIALAFTAPCRAEDEKAAPTVAHIRLAGSLDEAPVPADLPFGTALENFKSKLDRIKKAEKDPAVKALYLQLDGASIGLGKLDELSKTIHDFRKSGKKVYAYVESGEPRDYLLALACDEVVMPESGWLMLVGMRMEVSFYKELFDKIGVKADMLQMGDFKGAAEPFTRTNLSEPNRKQLQSLLDDNFDHSLVGRIHKERPKLSVEQIKKLIDEGPYTAKAAQKAGLIDRVSYADAYQDTIKTELKADKINFAKNYAAAKMDDLDLSSLTGLMKILSPPKPRVSKKPKVAVIYATGVITTGKSSPGLLGGDSCGSTTMVEAIRQAENDETVKAIVLRVDSPGGSALASDLIWNELRKCKKPVVASMSDVAASGGYYISMPCRKIYAEPGTLTGSIGVIGGKLTLGGLYEKVGITTETLSRGAHANILSTTHPFTESEKKAFTSLMRDVYDQFLDKAVAGRQAAGNKEMTRAKLESLAGGRVWTGRQAKANGLIDELGTLEEAVAAAWKMADQPADKEPELLVLPKGRSPLDALLSSLGEMRVSTVDQQLLRELPELSRKLAGVDAMLRLRGEPVWLIQPFSIEMK